MKMVILSNPFVPGMDLPKPSVGLMFVFDTNETESLSDAMKTQLRTVALLPTGPDDSRPLVDLGGRTLNQVNAMLEEKGEPPIDFFPTDLSEGGGS